MTGVVRTLFTHSLVTPGEESGEDGVTGFSFVSEVYGNITGFVQAPDLFDQEYQEVVIMIQEAALSEIF